MDATITRSLTPTDAQTTALVAAARWAYAELKAAESVLDEAKNEHKKAKERWLGVVQQISEVRGSQRDANEEGLPEQPEQDPMGRGD